MPVLVSTVDVRSLTIGEVLGSGGQADVLALENDPSLAFKRYHDPDHPQLNPNALRRLIAARESITYDGRAVDEFAAWPTAEVVDRSKTIGLLMRRIPNEFMLQMGGKTRPAELSYIATPPKPIWGSVKLPDLRQRIEIVRQFALAMDALHQRSLVLGDVSFLNVLWACRPSPRIMLLDCDGMRYEGERPVLPQPDSVDWNDPQATPGSEPDLDRDRYKLALAALRVLTTRLDVRPTSKQSLPEVEQPIRGLCEPLMAKAAGTVGTRPKASEWANALSGREYRPVRPIGPPRKDDAPLPKPDLIFDPNEPRQYRPIKPPRISP
jgi:hypothetical protein